MPLSSGQFAIVERPRTNSRIFAHTRWDIIPVTAALLHCAYFFGMFYLFPSLSGCKFFCCNDTRWHDTHSNYG